MRCVLLVEGVWRSGVHRGEYDGRVNTSPVRGPTGGPRGGQQMPHLEQLQGEKASFLSSPPCLSSRSGAEVVKLEAVLHV